MLRPSHSTLRITAIGTILLSGLGSAAALALSPSGPPAPLIVSGPGHLTPRRVASFRFTDVQRGVSFRCSINMAPFRICHSPARFGGRPLGRNLFRVEARTRSGAISAWARYVWTVAPLPPALAVSAPVANQSYSATSWAASCGGVCGTLRIGKGRPVLSVSIRQLATGRYWNGHGYVGPRAVWSRATLARALGGQRAWSYRLPLPPRDGGYIVGVRSVSRREVIAGGRRRTITGHRIHMLVSFSVNTAAPAPPGGPPVAFTIATQTSGRLYPGGTPQDIALTLGNPSDETIHVTSVSVALQATRLPSGCSPSGFQIRQPSLPAAGVIVPARTSVTLPAGSVGAGSIQMVDTGADQNACQSAALVLNLTGAAHS